MSVTCYGQLSESTDTNIARTLDFAPAIGRSPGLRTRAQRKTIAMNTITHAQTNSVSLELDNSNRSALDKLQALCGEFDTLCKSARRMSRTDKIFLALLEDELWVLTRRLCA